MPPVYLYDDFAERWRRPGIDILVHSKGASSNIAYKTDSVLLTSLYLGAVPLVTDEIAFARAGENEGIIKVNGASSEWSAAIERVRDANVRAELMKRLEAYCRSHFDPAYNAGVFETILASAKPAGIGDRLERFSMIIEKTATRLIEAEAQLGSRAFRLAVRLRKLANIARHGSRWLRRG
ncbi:MAG: hypothetical protein ACREFM_20260 [Hypericibacter sp.]